MLGVPYARVLAESTSPLLVRPRVALVIGDTAGHAYPAVALAEALRAREPMARITFIAAPQSTAAGILTREGISFQSVPGAPIRGVRASDLVRNLWITTHAVAAARRLLADGAIELVVGFGGYATGGVLLAARTLGLATLIHEANVEPGLANRWLRLIVDRTCVAHAEAIPRAVAVGMPVRSAIARLDAARQAPAGRPLRVLVATGSRGASFFERVMPVAVLRALQAGVPLELVQQSVDDQSDLGRIYHAMGVQARVAPFFTDMPSVYSWADVAVTRGGANTLAELAVAGLPAAVVPLADAAADHQRANARRWSLAGAGPMVPETPEAGAQLGQWLIAMGRNREHWESASAVALSLSQLDAAARLAECCCALVRRVS